MVSSQLEIFLLYYTLLKQYYRNYINLKTDILVTNDYTMKNKEIKTINEIIETKDR